MKSNSKMKTRRPRRWLSFLLAIITIMSLVPASTIPVSAAENVPDSLKVGTVDIFGTYHSDHLNTVTLRHIPVTLDGDAKSYVGFCYDHSAGLSLNGLPNKWDYLETVTASQTAAAPFLSWYAYHMAAGTWSGDAWTQSTAAAWVQAALWLAQAGILTDYSNAAQQSILSVERTKALGGTVTQADSLALIQTVVSEYKAGALGEFVFHIYNHTNASSIQPILVPYRVPQVATYSAYIKLQKTANGSSLAGATFGVYANSGCSIELGRFVTASTQWSVSGELRLEQNMPTTTLYVKEISTGNSNLKLDTTVYSVFVDGNVHNTPAAAAAVNGGAPIVNEILKRPDAESVIQKIDGATGAGVGPATFNLTGTAENGNYVSKDITTDATGSVKLQWLDATAPNYILPGSYTVTEKVPPANYEKTEQSQHLRLWLEWVADVSYEGGGYYVPHNSGPIVFENYAKHTITLQKLNANGSGLGGAVFDVYFNGTKMTSLTTSSTGTAILNDVKSGYYEFWERTAPAGHLIPTYGYSKGIYVDAADTTVTNHQVTFTNYQYPEIVIEKYSAASKLPLAGAQFKVTIDGTTLGTFTTKSNGVITISYEQYGKFLNDANDSWTVRVEETSAPEGHFLSTPNWQENEIRKGQALSPFVFYNQKLPDIVVHKTDSSDGKPLADTEFTLRSVSGTMASRIAVSDKDGIATFRTVPAGTYELFESTVPTGYLLSPKVITVVVKEGGAQKLEFEYKNDRAPSLLIVKRDSITGDRIPQTKFQLNMYNAEGGKTDLGIFYTDERGEIKLENLPECRIEAIEVEPVYGYAIKGTGTQEVYLKGNDSKTLYFDNTPLSAIIVKKLNTDASPLPLPGMVFQVRYLGGDQSGSGGTIIGEYATTENGTYVITGLKRGYYIIEEKIPPAGHALSAESVQTVFVSGNDQDIITVTFRNQRNPGFLLLKRDASDKSTPLGGVLFKITDSSGKAIGDNGGIFETGTDGTISIPDLPPNTTLLVQEIQAKDGYVLDGTVHTAKLNANSVYEMVLYNERLGGLLLVKRGSVGNELLSGVQYKITYADGSVVGNSNGIFTTDRNGEIKIEESFASGTTLLITEVKAKDGYLLDSTVHSVQIKESGKLHTLTLYNEPIGGVEVVKVDADSSKTRIPGIEFEIRHMNGAYVGRYETGRDGRFTVALEPGWYTLTEIDVGDSGYILDPTPINFEVRKGQTTTVQVKNEKGTQILLHKINAVTKEGIPNIKFLLLDKNMKPLGIYTTDQSGYIYINADDKIPAGKYFLQEIEATGYELDAQIRTVYLETGKVNRIIWENQPLMGQIQVLKYSLDYNPITGIPAGSALQGAVFEIAQERSGKVVAYITSDARGVAASDPLPLGRYVLREVMAPPYTQLDPTPHLIHIEYGGQIIKQSVFNRSATLGVSINKVGNQQVLAGDSMRYDFTVSNDSNVPLDSFSWRDQIPVDGTRAVYLTTGTYSARQYYSVHYRTNYNDYCELGKNLLTTVNHSFDLSSISLMSGEVITDIKLEFGTAPAGFTSVVKPTITVSVLPGLNNGYQLVNRAYIAGKYMSQWEYNHSSWITAVVNLKQNKPLPKTGY